MSDPFEGLAPSLVPLCTVAIRFRPSIVIDSGLEGRRLIVEIESVDLQGERIRAALHGRAAADWVRVSRDGRLGILDVRATLETDDGALVFTEYRGRVRFGANQRHAVFAAPCFTTNDPRYAWLEGIQALGKGVSDTGAGTLHYRMFELA